MLVLRHERRMPASAASLVQKVGKGVFVFPSVSSELHHDSLVFFHRTMEIMTVNTPSFSGAEAEK